MGLIELILIAISLSMDALAVAICKGLSMTKLNMRQMVTVGVYFGVFQAVMPLIGFFAGTRFSSAIEAYDHWVVFILLLLIGLNMIRESFKKEIESTDGAEEDNGTSTGIKAMLPLALATSVDALAVGITFAILDVNIVRAVTLIGITTLLLSMLGVLLGSLFGSKYKAHAEIAGGAVLILIGLKVLLEHTGIINF